MIYKVNFFILFTFIVSAKSMVYGISKTVHVIKVRFKTSQYARHLESGIISLKKTKKTVHVIKVRFRTSQYARHLESGIIGLWSGGGWGEGGVRGREET